jgi:hypothetical protein
MAEYNWTPRALDIARRLTSDLMRDQGWNREQATGFVGNLAKESYNPRTREPFGSVQEGNPIGGGRGGLGWVQWTGPRRNDFETLMAREGLTDPGSYEANYAMLRQDLAGDYAYIARRIGAAPTMEAASRITHGDYLRPYDVAGSGFPEAGTYETGPERLDFGRQIYDDIIRTSGEHPQRPDEFGRYYEPTPIPFDPNMGQPTAPWAEGGTAGGLPPGYEPTWGPGGGLPGSAPLPPTRPGDLDKYGFDEAAYYKANPDVQAAGMDGYEHYSTSGWKEGREGAVTHIGGQDFAGAFAPGAYMFNNKDVGTSGMDPWAHFSQYGINEGRQGAGLVDNDFLGGPNYSVPSMLHTKGPHGFGGFNTESADPFHVADNIGWSPNNYTPGSMAFPGAPPAFGGGPNYPTFAGDNPPTDYAGTITVAPYEEDPTARGFEQEYLRLNPDVAQSGMSGWDHYDKYGRNEGRPTPGGWVPTEGTMAWGTQPTPTGYVVPGGSDYGTFPGHFSGPNMGGTEDLAKTLTQNEANMAEQARQQAEFLRLSQERDRQAQDLFNLNMTRNGPGGGGFGSPIGGPGSISDYF